MSAKKKNRKKAVLAVLVVVVLVGACLGAVAIYAKHEMEKPTFAIPDEEYRPSVTQLPVGKDDMSKYLDTLYDAAVSADDCEGSWYTDAGVELNFDDSTLSDADKAVINYIKDGAGGQLRSFYEEQQNVLMSKTADKPEFFVDGSDVVEYTAEEGRTQEDGTIEEGDFYFVKLISKAAAAYEGVDFKNYEAFKSIKGVLDEALKVTSFNVTPQDVTTDFKINRIYDKMTNVDVTRVFDIDAEVEFIGDYAALGAQDIKLTYTERQHITFNWYGAEFVDRFMIVNPDDMKALPAKVTVNAEATKEDYVLTFTPSVEGVVTIDEDGVMTVEEMNEDPIFIDMKLEYDGHTYTDTLKVYITDLEVDELEQQ